MTPRAEETLVRLASWMPFASAQELLQDLLGVQVSLAMAHRATLVSGQAGLAVCEREEERLQQEVPQAFTSRFFGEGGEVAQKEEKKT